MIKPFFAVNEGWGGKGRGEGGNPPTRNLNILSMEAKPTKFATFSRVNLGTNLCDMAANDDEIALIFIFISVISFKFVFDLVKLGGFKR